MSYTFTPEHQVVASINGLWLPDTLLRQQGMYGADIEFAYEHAGAALKHVLKAIPEWYHRGAEDAGLELNIDVRVHELEVGDFPATPGWHCDAPRRETAFSDGLDTVPVQNSIVANVSTHPEGVSNTVFASHPVTLDDDRMDQGTWRAMDTVLGTDLSNHVVSKDGELVMFSCFTPHCIQPAKNAGIRMFVRISQWSKPQGFVPGLTKSEQVYRTIKSR